MSKRRCQELSFQKVKKASSSTMLLAYFHQHRLASTVIRFCFVQQIFVQNNYTWNNLCAHRIEWIFLQVACIIVLSWTNWRLAGRARKLIKGGLMKWKCLAVSEATTCTDRQAYHSQSCLHEKCQMRHQPINPLQMDYMYLESPHTLKNNGLLKADFSGNVCHWTLTY